MPILAAATVKKVPHFRPRHVPAVLIAAVSTHAALRVLKPPRRLGPYAAYRTLLAITLLWEDRHR